MDDLQRGVARGRKQIGRGERPVYHVVTTFDGSAVDVRIQELPLIHLFVPADARVLDAARGLVAQTLGVEPSTFEVVAKR